MKIQLKHSSSGVIKNAKVIFALWFVLSIFAACSNEQSEKSSGSNNKTVDISQSPNAVTKPLSQANEPVPNQKEFFKEILGFGKKYHDAKNEIQQSSVKDNMVAYIKQSFGDGTLLNWKGSVASLTTDKDGNVDLLKMAHSGMLSRDHGRNLPNDEHA